MKIRKFHHYLLIALAVIVLDQFTKWLAYEYLRDHTPVHLAGNWLKLHYTTNPGMAFGFVLELWWGKLALTLFRFVAMFLIIWYMKNLIQKNAHTGLLICIALILAGAVGNLVDSTFYGILDPELLVEKPVPPFALFHGQVIDFMYIDIGEFWGMHLWPIFNVADSSIFVAVSIILVRQKAFFGSLKKEPNVEEVNSDPIKDTDPPTAF